MAKLNEVDILGTKYAVRRVPYISRNEYRVGEIGFESQEIKILDTLSDDAAGIAFFHELLHGILMALRYLEENDDEKLVQGLAVGLYQALDGNSDFRKLYRKVDASPKRKVGT